MRLMGVVAQGVVRGLLVGCERQPDQEFAAVAEAFAAGDDRAAMELDQPTRQSQADAQSTAAGPSAVLRHLGEHPEHLFELSGGNAQSGIAHAYERMTTLAADPQLDLASRVGISGGVAEHVGDDLREALQVAIDAE